jgi:CRISPR-associated protein Cas2
MTQRHWYLITYDVRNAKRLRRVFRTLKGSGQWLQYSVFRCRLTKRQKESLRWDLERIMTAEDDLMFIELCPSCAGSVEERRAPQDWGDPNRHEIL